MPGVALLVLAWLLGPSPEAATPEAAHPAPTQAAPAVAPTPTPSAEPAAPATAEPAPTLADPWASVPIQRVVPNSSSSGTAHAAASPGAHAPLLDPWSGTRRGAPRKLDPELRDPFGTLRVSAGTVHLARADLRDPFARANHGSAQHAAPAAASPEPSMPLHPDLRDPFGRRRAKPSPPPASAAPSSAPVTPRDHGQVPSPGAWLPTPQPFAHLPATRSPA